MNTDQNTPRITPRISPINKEAKDKIIGDGIK